MCCLESTAVAGAGEEVELDGVMVHGAELIRDEVRGYARGYQLVRGSLEMTGPGVVVKKTRMSAPNHDPHPRPLPYEVRVLGELAVEPLPLGSSQRRGPSLLMVPSSDAIESRFP